jgi:hypothetical protein
MLDRPRQASFHIPLLHRIRKFSENRVQRSQIALDMMRRVG